MKTIPVLQILALMTFILMGCTQESTKIKNSSSSNPLVCVGADYYKQGCPGYGQNGGACTNPTVNDKTCSNYCTVHPTGSGCLANGTNCNIYPSAPGCNGSGTGNNPHPYYGSMYVEKNWMVKYPYVPSVSCSDPFTPSGITYTPYDTRKGTITLAGKSNYNPASGQTYTDTTSELLRSVQGAQDFFWGDSTLKVRFKANLQPESRNTTDVCAGRTPNQSWMKGYSRIRFTLTLVGTNINGTIRINLGQKTIDINKCTPAMDLSNYAKQFPMGLYFEVSNVEGNQNWSPSVSPWYEQQDYDTWGFYPNRSYNGNSYMRIRDADCWSLDVEVAADGTKTFN